MIKKTLLLLVLVLITCGLPATSGAEVFYTNEPSGFAQQMSCNMSPISACGIFDVYGSSIPDNDGSAPKSPTGVLRSTLAAGSPTGGMQLGKDFTAANEVFMGLSWRTNPEFQGRHVLNKLWFLGSSSGAGFWGIQRSDRRIVFSHNSNIVDNRHICADDGLRCVPNAGPGIAEFGTWHKIEVYVRGSTTKTSRDGILRWWVNGALAGNYTTFNWYAPTFTFWAWTETWDSCGQNPVTTCDMGSGPNGLNTVPWHHYLDHLYISTRGGGGPVIPPPGDTTPPSQVTGVSASNVLTTSATLNWSAAVDNVAATGYLIERCQGDGCANFASIGSTTVTTFTNTGLAPGTSYSYRLKAHDAANNVSVSYSATVTVTTQSSNLPTVTSVTTDATGADVTWSGSPSSIRVFTDTINVVEPMSAFGSGTQNIVHVQDRSTTGSGSNAVLSYTANNTAGNLLALRLKAPAGITITNVTDTRGNTWAAIPNATGGVQGYQAMRYVANCAAGSNTVTVTLSGSAASFELDLLEYSGADTVSPLTQARFNEQGDPGTGANAITTGNITTANNGELILGAAMYPGSEPGATVTSGTGYTLRQNASGTSPVADKILASAGTTTATFTTNVVGGGTTLADIAFVQRVLSGYQTNTTQIARTMPSNVTAGNALIWYGEFGFNRAVTSISGCGSGWARAVERADNTESTAIWYLLNATGGACTVTATFDGAVNYGTVGVAEYSGVAASSALDVTAGQVHTPGTGTDAISSGTATTTVDKALIVGLTNQVLGGGSQSISAGTGFTCRDRMFGFSCASAGDATYEDKILATAGSAAATFTGTNAASGHSTVMAAFKPAAVGAAQWFLSSVASFRPQSVTGSRYNRLWAPTTTFACFAARDAVGNETEQYCNAVTPNPVDTTPPTVSNPLPSGTLASGITSTTMSVQTNEPAVCRYSGSAGTAYAAMVNTMTASGLVHSAPFDGLTAGNTFTRYVRCADTAGNPTTADTVVTFDVEAAPSDTTPPSQVTGLAVALLGPTQVGLTWNPANDDTGVTGYQVWICDSVCVFTLAKTVSGTTATIPGLTSGVSYHFKVRAVDAVLNGGDFSDPPVGITMPSTDSTVPSTLTGMVATAVDFQTLTLTWEAGTDDLAVTHTEIEQCEGANCTRFELIATVTGVGTTLQVGGLRPNTAYRFRGKHFDAAGNASVAYSTAILGATPDVPAGTVMGLCPCKHVR